ncbi:MAG: hypothetical protein RMA76_02420 [Deltaproteobacteria bacterium]|jgi:tetratricopeptide (TPR) repeat protein
MATRVPWGLFLAIALLAGLGHLRPVSDPDVWWHLEAADAVLEHGSATYPDQTSFTVPGRPFADHPWLGQMFLRAAFRMGGVAGLSWFAAICGFFVTLAIAWAAWEFSERRPYTAVIATALITPIVTWRFEPRPLIIFLALLPIALVLARRLALESGRAVLGFGGALVLLQAFWLPIHGSFVLLPAVTGIALLSALPRHGLRAALIRSSVVLAQVALILAFGNLGEHAKLIENVALGDATSHITEMRPLEWQQLIPTHLNSIAFLDLALVVGTVRAVRLRSFRPRDIFYVLLGMALAFTAHRFRAAWGLLCIPFVARPSAGEDDARSSKWLALALVLTTVPAVTYNDVERSPARGFGAGLSRDAFPVDAVDFLEAIEVQGNVLNVYEDGGYLTFRVGPEVRIAIDGRTPTVFDDELYFLIREAKRNPHAFATFEKRYQPNMVLTKASWRQCRFLQASGRWRAVFIDTDRRLFFADGFRPDVARLTTVDPCAPDASLDQACARGKGAEAFGDLDKMLRVVPEATYPLQLASTLVRKCGNDPARAVALAEAALANGTRRPGAWLIYANALAAAGSNDEALNAADFAEAMGAGPSAQLLTAGILRDAGRLDEALEAYAGVSAAFGDQLPYDVRLDYAEALVEAGRLDVARLHARRASWTRSSTRARILLERIGAP